MESMSGVLAGNARIYITYIQHGVEEDVDAVLLHSCHSMQEFVFGAPSRSNGALLVEFPKVPLNEYDVIILRQRM